MSGHVLVDTHAHLNFDSFDEDREDVIRRAREAQIGAIINVAVDVPTSEASVALAEAHPEVWASAGVHPQDAHTLDDTGRQRLEELVRHPKVVAVGEVGLDFYRDYNPREVQEKVFREMLDLARMADLPLIIHTRDSMDRALEILEEKLAEGPLRGVFHCFSGGRSIIDRVLNLGFHISFCGNLTFKNSRLPEVLDAVPLERLLLETDSPFMAPVPHRGKRNEPAFVRLTARKIAEVKGVPLEEVVTRTTENAVRLFGLKLVS